MRIEHFRIQQMRYSYVPTFDIYYLSNISVEAKVEKPKPAPKAPPKPEPVEELSLEEQAIAMVSIIFLFGFCVIIIQYL